MDEAEEYILKGIKILEELKTQPYVSTGYLWLGELNADMGQREKALENLKTAEAMFKEMGMDYWLAKTKEVGKGIMFSSPPQHFSAPKGDLHDRQTLVGPR
jgi:hypothetical protein